MDQICIQLYIKRNPKVNTLVFDKRPDSLTALKHVVLNGINNCGLESGDLSVFRARCLKKENDIRITPITPLSLAGEYFFVEVAAEEDRILPPPAKIVEQDADAKENAVTVEQLAQFEKRHEAKDVG